MIKFLLMFSPKTCKCSKNHKLIDEIFKSAYFERNFDVSEILKWEYDILKSKLQQMLDNVK